MSFIVKTQSFEGPLDLLLDMIEKRKLFISDISLAKVADDFIAHITQSGLMSIGESAHFILVASTLLLIKSKSLLPELVLNEEEKGDIKDLENRLRILAKIKEGSKHIEEIFGKNIIFLASQSRPTVKVFAPDPNITLTNALKCMIDLVNRLPKKENIPKHMVKKVISLEEVITSLTERISSHLRMSFREFTSEHKADKVNVIVSFLAMLELVKDGVLHATQDATFGEINMETKDVGVPHYQ